MSLLPAKMQNTDFMPLTLGTKVVKPVAKPAMSKEAEFELWNHDQLPFGGAPKPRDLWGISFREMGITKEFKMCSEPIELEDFYAVPKPPVPGPVTELALGKKTLVGAQQVQRYEALKQAAVSATEHLFPDEKTTQRQDAVAVKMAAIHKAKQELRNLVRRPATSTRISF